jgi:hypothetical protein
VQQPLDDERRAEEDTGDTDERRCRGECSRPTPTAASSATGDSTKNITPREPAATSWSSAMIRANATHATALAASEISRPEAAQLRTTVWTRRNASGSPGKKATTPRSG